MSWLYPSSGLFSGTGLCHLFWLKDHVWPCSALCAPSNTKDRELFAWYINWFCSYWTDRMFHACYCGGLSSPYELLAGVPQEAFLGPLLFRILMNDLCNVVRYSDCLLFVDGIETFNGINSHQGSSLHQPVVTVFCAWCISNFMKPSVNTTRVISFTRTNHLLGFDCKLCESSILHSLTASKICSWFSDSPRAGRSGSRILVGTRFSAPFQTDAGAHPVSHTMGTGSLSQG